MPRLGVIIDMPHSQTTTRKSSVNEYDDLLVIRPQDLPNGIGRPYAVILQGYVGNFTQSNWAVQTITRFGLRVRGAGQAELPWTWNMISRRDSPLSNGNRFGIPFCMSVWINGWPPGMELVFSGHQLTLTAAAGLQANAVFDGLMAMVIDAQAMGGSPTLSGWDGDRIRVVQRTTTLNLNVAPTAPLLLADLGNLPWTSGTQQWLVAWSEQVHLKDNRSGTSGAEVPTEIRGDLGGTPRFRVRARPQNGDVGTNNNLDGLQVQHLGGWFVSPVSNGTTAPKMYGASTTAASYSIGARGCIIGVRVDDLDGFHYEEVLGQITEGFGRSPGIVTQEYQSTTPNNRDLPRLVAMAAQHLRSDVSLLDYPPAFGVTAAQNRRFQFSRDPARQLYSYLRDLPGERYPVMSALVTPATYPAILASAAYYDWHVSPEVPLYGSTHLVAVDRQFMALALSDDGAIEDPPDPVFTDVQIHPGYEAADLSSLPEFLEEPEPALPVDEAGRAEMINADLSVSTWGAHTTPGRVYPLAWTMRRADAIAMLEDLQEKRTFRWTPPLEEAATEIAVLASNPRVAHDGNGLSRVTAAGIEQVYFAPPP